MDYAFDWTAEIANSDKASVEEQIRATQASGHSYVSFCHTGQVTVTLSPTGLFHDSIVGHLRCHCGKLRGMVTGAIDGSHIVIEAL